MEYNEEKGLAGQPFYMYGEMDQSDLRNGRTVESKARSKKAAVLAQLAEALGSTLDTNDAKAMSAAISYIAEN